MGKFRIVADHAKQLRFHVLLSVLPGKDFCPEDSASNPPGHGEGALGFCIRIQKTYPAVERTIASVRESFRDRPEVGETFEKCLSDTLQRTVTPREDGMVDVIMGDIPAMWLRDSACQFAPFIRLAKEERGIREILTALSLRHAALIREDPYA